jgi:hypothetical protein
MLMIEGADLSQKSPVGMIISAAGKSRAVSFFLEIPHPTTILVQTFKFLFD